MHQNAKNTNIKWKVKPNLAHFEDTEKNQGFKHPIKSEAWQSKFKKKNILKKTKILLINFLELKNLTVNYFYWDWADCQNILDKKPFFIKKLTKTKKLSFFSFWKVFCYFSSNGERDSRSVFLDMSQICEEQTLQAF